MSNEFVTVRNTVTGRVGEVRRRIAEHVVYGEYLEIVPAGTKSRIDLTELVDQKVAKAPKPTPKPAVEPAEEDE